MTRAPSQARDIDNYLLLNSRACTYNAGFKGLKIPTPHKLISQLFCMVYYDWLEVVLQFNRFLLPVKRWPSSVYLIGCTDFYIVVYIRAVNDT